MPSIILCQGNIFRDTSLCVVPIILKLPRTENWFVTFNMPNLTTYNYYYLSVPVVLVIFMPRRGCKPKSPEPQSVTLVTTQTLGINAITAVIQW